MDGLRAGEAGAAGLTPGLTPGLGSGVGPDLVDGLRPVLRALADPAPPSADFDVTPGLGRAPGLVLRPAAVLLALQPGPAGWEMVLTRRAARLLHHPGQIALPGGKLDANDPGPVTAALREAREEVGLPPEAVELLGTLNPHETVTGFSVTPVVGWLRAPFVPVPDRGEVAEVFAVPLRHLADPGRYRLEGRRWRGVRRNYWVLPWGPYYIWGATARILRGLAERMGGQTGDHTGDHTGNHTGNHTGDHTGDHTGGQMGERAGP